MVTTSYYLLQYANEIWGMQLKYSGAIFPITVPFCAYVEGGITRKEVSRGRRDDTFFCGYEIGNDSSEKYSTFSYFRRFEREKAKGKGKRQVRQRSLPKTDL